jgi:hypothetical protein
VLSLRKIVSKTIFDCGGLGCCIISDKLYKLGYRSLGVRCATQKGSDIRAWMQDLEILR